MRKSKYNEDGERWCSGTGLNDNSGHWEKPNAFGRDAGFDDGLNTRCRACKSIWNTSTTKKQYNDKRYTNASWNNIYAQRYKESKKGKPYDITVTRLAVYLASFGMCHICEKFVPFESKWVMEHVDGNEGWTWDNIRIAHVHCNGRKHDRLMPELEALGILAEMRHPAYTKMMPLALTSGSNDGIMYTYSGRRDIHAGTEA